MILYQREAGYLEFRKGGKMPSVQKLIQKMKQQPNGIRSNEIVRVLENSGYTMKSKTRNFTQKFYK